MGPIGTFVPDLRRANIMIQRPAHYVTHGAFVWLYAQLLHDQRLAIQLLEYKFTVVNCYVNNTGNWSFLRYSRKAA